MRPTLEQRRRLSIAEERLLRWLRFQSAAAMVDAGLLDILLEGRPAHSRERALTLTRRAIDPDSGDLDGGRLLISERNELETLLGLREDAPKHESEEETE